MYKVDAMLSKKYFLNILNSKPNLEHPKSHRVSAETSGMICKLDHTLRPDA